MIKYFINIHMYIINLWADAHDQLMNTCPGHIEINKLNLYMNLIKKSTHCIYRIYDRYEV